MKAQHHSQARGDSKATMPADPLDFWPPVMWENKYLFKKRHRYKKNCCGFSIKLIHVDRIERACKRKARRDWNSRMGGWVGFTSCLMDYFLHSY